MSPEKLTIVPVIYLREIAICHVYRQGVLTWLFGLTAQKGGRGKKNGLH